MTVKNYEANLTTVSVQKAWKDASGADITATAGAEVTFSVYESGSNTALASVTLDGTVDDAGEDAAWKAVFKRLPKYADPEDESTLINYVVKETSVVNADDFSNKNTAGVANGGTIINQENTPEPETMTVTATKTWVNLDGTYTAPLGASVTITLCDGDNKPVSITGVQTVITLDGTQDETGEDSAWTAVFKNLPKYNGSDLAVYTVKETSSPDGYIATVTSTADGYAIENRQTSVAVSATKVWKSASGELITNADELGYKVKFSLYADGVETAYYVVLDGSIDPEVEPGTTPIAYESGKWTASFKNLPGYKYAADGTATAIVYKIVENDTPAGFISDCPAAGVENGGTITNTQSSITITKVDENGNPLAGVRLRLTADLSNDAWDSLKKSISGVASPKLYVTYESGADKTFSGIGFTTTGAPIDITGLPVGVVYTITEVNPADNYNGEGVEVIFRLNEDGTVTVNNSKVENNNIVITNKLLETRVFIQKVDGNGQPLSGAVFAIYSDVECTEQIGSEQTTEEDGITTFTGLKAGSTYYVKEVSAPAGYVLIDTVIKITVGGTNGVPYIVIDANGNTSITTYVGNVDKINSGSDDPDYERDDDYGPDYWETETAVPVQTVPSCPELRFRSQAVISPLISGRL